MLGRVTAGEVLDQRRRARAESVWDHALRDAARSFAIDLSAFAFMGDDVNDLPALRLAGFKAAPCTAHPAVLREAEFISDRPAGAGAVRSMIDHLWGEAINR